MMAEGSFEGAFHVVVEEKLVFVKEVWRGKMVHLQLEGLVRHW